MIKVLMHLLILIALCIPSATQAEISIYDMWAASGRLKLENADWSALFSKDEGAVSIYSKTKETVKIAPFCSENENSLSHKAQTILSCKVIERQENRVGIRAFFSDGQNQIEGGFFFDPEGTIEVKPLQNMKGILVLGEIAFGIVPSPPLEDLVYPKEHSSASHLYIPSENVFLGLLKEESGLFFCAWPDGNQRVKLLFANNAKDQKLFQAVEIKLDGKSVYLRSIIAPGIWHQEELLSNSLEKDVEIKWKRPFPAKWKTQLIEGELETTFPFRTQKDRIWRPILGFYTYPIWFEGEKAFLHLSKKVLPSGKVLIYALEGHKDTAVEFARASLGSLSRLNPKVSLQRISQNNVGLNFCDGRAWVQWIFRVGLQTREKEFLQEVLADFLHSITVDKGRLEEYKDFIQKMKREIDSWMEMEKDNPELELLLRQWKEKVEKIEKVYWEKMDGLTASEHLQNETEGIEKVKALIGEEGLEVYPEALYLLDGIQLWSLMEAVPAAVGGLFRELFQQAGYDCANNIDAVKYAEELRRDIREFLISGATYETVY